jgi:hypothetical protein
VLAIYQRLSEVSVSTATQYDGRLTHPPPRRYGPPPHGSRIPTNLAASCACAACSTPRFVLHSTRTLRRRGPRPPAGGAGGARPPRLNVRVCCVVLREGGCAPPGRWRGRPPPSRPACMYVPAASAPSIIVRDRNRRLLGRSQPERRHGRTDATDAAPHVSLGIIIATVLRRCG